jgi:hypothetical protein
MTGDSNTAGSVAAKQMASMDGKKTLEMMLESSDFQRRFDLAYQRLSEKLGDEMLWKEFGELIWQRVSEKYAKTLEGRVNAYVMWTGKKGVFSDLHSGREPILLHELDIISEMMELNPKITSVEFVDVFEGTRHVMSRVDVLRAASHTH